MLNKLGYTLLELLVTLGVMSILLIMAIPMAHYFYQKNDCKIISDKLKNAIRFSRNMALAKGESLMLTPLEKDNWSTGVALFTITTTLNRLEKGQLLQVWQWPKANYQILWVGFQSKKHLIFSSLMRYATCSGHFSLMDKGVEKERLIINRLCHIRNSHGHV